MKTMTSGGIPPAIERVTLLRVTYAIGTGSQGDPIRGVCAWYDEAGHHLWSFSEGMLLAASTQDATP